MSVLEIKLNKEYKSFMNGFTTSIAGNLVILSGVNGAGKTQLINSIIGFDKNTGLNLPSTITLNGKIITKEEIDFRSFKENINILEITNSTSQTFLSSVDNAWNSYLNYRLNPSDPNLGQYSDSCIEAKKILLTKFSETEFNDGSINETEFKLFIKSSNFIWKTGDRFTNIIGEIFFLHTLKMNKKMVEVGRDNFNANMLDEAPWIKLNKLFQQLRFDYRFKETYELNDVEINELPKLFAINQDGSIDKNSSRQLFDLSDGEKTIISLCFATLLDKITSEKKLLLLDELDSVLNPSLIEMFFFVIEEYFIKQEIMVLISTHSSATISLSPDYTTFYEVFKPNQKNIRILEVQKDDYSELLIANKRFYDKISNQQNRINELEQTIVSNQDILIITEGKTDWKYYLSALRYFHTIERFNEINESYFYQFGTEQEVTESICNTKEVNELNESKLKNYLSALVDSRSIDNNNLQLRIGIFDSDTNISPINNSDKNVFSIKLVPNGISTEFLFSDKEIKTVINGRRLYIGNEFDERAKRHTVENLNLGGDPNNINKAGKRTIIEKDVYNSDIQNIALSKEIFARAVFNNEFAISSDSWNNFVHIFEFISSKLTGGRK